MRAARHHRPQQQPGVRGGVRRPDEHLSDVFGILVKQKHDNKTADAADWLMGEACFMPAKKGIALRNMLHP